MRLLCIGLALTCSAIGFADTLILRSGRVIQGTFLGGTARQVRMDLGDRIETVDVTDVSRIEFNPPVAAPAPPPPPPPEALPRRESNVFRPDPEPVAVPAQSARSSGELPAGTNLVVRLIEGVDSETNRVGQTFAASLDEPVMINGETVIPRGADAVVKLVDSKDSGKFTGRSELTLSLASVKVNGQPVDINSQTVSRESSSRGERTAKVAGGTAAVGAIIGAIAGGGKGAAIGAAAGGAAGAGAEVVTKGQRVKIPSETRLTFSLETPVRL
ncbi:MAG TPA: hypothetical protein VLY24_24300 [Bryobacteraceae bacterium]|nr:hypothetical protein [Bryobacteraceae bacterium]